MDQHDLPSRGRPRGHGPRPASNQARFGALGSLMAAIVILLVIVLGSGGGSGSRTTAQQTTSAHTSTQTTSSATPSRLGARSVPILAYNVINSQPLGSPNPPALYVPPDQFAAQMQALKAAGWHAVTLDQMEASWTHGAQLGAGKPIVITFDGGFASHYANALPVLKRLGWPAVEDLPPTLLATSDGGLSDSQIRALVAAGWELAAEGDPHVNLTALSPTTVQTTLSSQRQTMSTQYGVPLHWFVYPGGHYNPTTTAAIRTAGFTGALTIITGWANPNADRTRLPRIEVAGGTSPSQLLSQITAAQTSPSVPPAS